MKEATKEDIYKAFQNVEFLLQLFETFSNNQAVGVLRFDRVAGNNTVPADDVISEDSLFCVWKCGHIHIKLSGYISSYGDRRVSRWDFVEPKEKVVLVYE